VAHKLSWFSTDHVGVLLPKIKKNPQNTNGRLAIPAPAGLLVYMEQGNPGKPGLCVAHIADCHILTKGES